MAPSHLPVPPALRSGPGARDEPRATSPTCAAGTAPPCARSIEAGFDIVYVYAAHDLSRSSTSSRAATTTAPTNTAAAREPRAAAARAARGHAEEVRRPRRRGAAASPSTSCSATRASSARGIAQVLALARRAARPLGRHHRRLGGRLRSPRASRDEARTGGSYVRGLKQLTTKPVVGVGRFTSPDTMVRHVRERRPRLHRRGAAVDRRSVPAEEDRGGPARRHPRVHRLQHLRHRRLHDDADPLHPEPDDGRGMAARLAPGAHPARRQRGARCSSSAPARPGSRRALALGQRGYDVELAEAATQLGGRVRARGAAARAGRLGPGASTTASGQLAQLPNVEIAFDSELTRRRGRSTSASTTSPIATGARWRRDGVGRWHTHAAAARPRRCRS